MASEGGASRLAGWWNFHIDVTGFHRLSSSMRSGSTCGSRSATETSRISLPSEGSTSPTRPSGAGY
jgi:hypothetical protein